jgi:hypothetical protein
MRRLVLLLLLVTLQGCAGRETTPLVESGGSFFATERSLVSDLDKLQRAREVLAWIPDYPDPDLQEQVLIVGSLFLYARGKPGQDTLWDLYYDAARSDLAGELSYVHNDFASETDHMAFRVTQGGKSQWPQRLQSRPHVWRDRRALVHLIPGRAVL